MRIEATINGKVVASDQSTKDWSVKQIDGIMKELNDLYTSCKIKLIG